MILNKQFLVLGAVLSLGLAGCSGSSKSDQDGGGAGKIGDLFRSAAGSLNTVGSGMTPAISVANIPTNEISVIESVIANYEEVEVPSPETANGFMLMMAEIMDGIASDVTPTFASTLTTFDGVNFSTVPGLCDGADPCNISLAMQTKVFEGSNWDHVVDLKVCRGVEIEITWENAAELCDELMPVTFLFNDRSDELAFKLVLGDEVSIFRLGLETGVLRYGTWADRDTAGNKFVSIAEGVVNSDGQLEEISSARHAQIILDAESAYTGFGVAFEDNEFSRVQLYLTAEEGEGEELKRLGFNSGDFNDELPDDSLFSELLVLSGSGDIEESDLDKAQSFTFRLRNEENSTLSFVTASFDDDIGDLFRSAVRSLAAVRNGLFVEALNVASAPATEVQAIVAVMDNYRAPEEPTSSESPVGLMNFLGEVMDGVTSQVTPVYSVQATTFNGVNFNGVAGLCPQEELAKLNGQSCPVSLAMRTKLYEGANWDRIVELKVCLGAEAEITWVGDLETQCSDGTPFPVSFLYNDRSDELAFKLLKSDDEISIFQLDLDLGILRFGFWADLGDNSNKFISISEGTLDANGRIEAVSSVRHAQIATYLYDPDAEGLAALAPELRFSAFGIEFNNGTYDRIRALRTGYDDEMLSSFNFAAGDYDGDLMDESLFAELVALSGTGDEATDLDTSKSFQFRFSDDVNSRLSFVTADFDDAE
jgi:hypothetical protein